MAATGKPFAPGKSGNPKGRPKASKTAPPTTANALRTRLADRAGEVLDTVVDAALGGDVAACKLILERVVPALKPMEQAVQVPIPTDGTLTEQGRAILSAVGAGALAPSQGAAVVQAIGTMARVLEVDELTRRVEALEKEKGL